LTADFPSDMPVIQADAADWSRCYLISSATPSSILQGRRGARDGPCALDEVIVSVSDEASGIPLEEQGRILSGFIVWTTRSAGAPPGADWGCIG